MTNWNIYKFVRLVTRWYTNWTWECYYYEFLGFLAEENETTGLQLPNMLTSVFTSSGHSVYNTTQIQRASYNFIPFAALESLDTSSIGRWLT